MNKVTAKAAVERLIRRREELVLTLRHLDKEQADVENNTDWLDQAAYANRAALLDRLAEGFQTELQQVDKALDRIKANRYGQCLACHASIDDQRLDAAPEAAFCSSCQEMREGLTSV